MTLALDIFLPLWSPHSDAQFDARILVVVAHVDAAIPRIGFAALVLLLVVVVVDVNVVPVAVVLVDTHSTPSRVTYRRATSHRCSHVGIDCRLSECRGRGSL